MIINNDTICQTDTNVLISLMLTSEYDYEVLTNADNEKYVKVKFKGGTVFKLANVSDFVINDLIEEDN